MPKWPMAMLSSPVIRFVHGWEMAGSATHHHAEQQPADADDDRAPGSPALASTMVSIVAMNSVWWRWEHVAQRGEPGEQQG